MNNQSPFFVKTPFIMDQMEKHFYDVLLHIVDSQYYIWPKVNLTNLLQPKIESMPEELYEKFCKLADEHVDFVLCDKEKFHPLLVIRFKGMISHTDDIYRDEVDTLKEILKSAEVPLLIESAAELDSFKDDVEYHALKNRIAEVLNKKQE